MSEETPKRERRRWTPLRILIWAAVAGFAVLVADLILFEIVQGRRRHVVSRRLEAHNDGRNLGLAAINYERLNYVLPPFLYGDTAQSVGRDGAPPVAWTTAILPYLDQTPVHEQIDFDKPYDHPANIAAFSTDLRLYRSPHVKKPPAVAGLAPAHWAGNRLVLETPHASAGLPDGAGQTLLIGEVNAVTGRPAAWGDPANLRTTSGPLNSPTGFGGNGPDGEVIVVSADGRARFISETIDPAVFAALGTPNGGEPVDPGDW